MDTIFLRIKGSSLLTLARAFSEGSWIDVSFHGHQHGGDPYVCAAVDDVS